MNTYLTIPVLAALMAGANTVGGEGQQNAMRGESTRTRTGALLERRARLNVLSELPGPWKTAVTAWRRQGQRVLTLAIAKAIGRRHCAPRRTVRVIRKIYPEAFHWKMEKGAGRLSTARPNRRAPPDGRQSTLR